MGRANSPSSRSERKTSSLWCPSAIPAGGCPRSRRTRSLMRSLPRSCMGPAWDCPSAAPSLNRIAVACGLPTTLRAAQVFTSFYPPQSRHMNDGSTAHLDCRHHPLVLVREEMAVVHEPADDDRIGERNDDLHLAV